MQARTVFPYLLATLISVASPFFFPSSLFAAPQSVPVHVSVNAPAAEETDTSATSEANTSSQNTPPQSPPPQSLSNEEWQNILAQTNLPNTLPNALPNTAAEVNVSSVSQQAYLKASNSDAVDSFGISTDLDGDTLVIGAVGEDSAADGVNGNQNDNSALDSGAVYVFVRTNGIWTQQAYLKASNSEFGDFFGWSVAIDGDTLVVGAEFEDSAADGVNGNQNDNSAFGAGAVYVFVRTGGVAGGVWSQQAYLKASNSDVLDHFGYSVDIAGDTLVVGAPDEDSAARGVNGNQNDDILELNAGAAYLFVRSGGVWSQQAYLKASNPDRGDSFGSSVAIAGNTLVVGAWSEASADDGVNGNQNDNSALGAGAAYVFVRTGSVAGGVWSQQAYLKASNSDGGDFFGISVAIAGDTLVVGAYTEASTADGVNGNQNDNSAPEAGAAYVFVRTNGIWMQQAYLKASNSDGEDNFCRSVAIAGNTLVVGAPNEASAADGVNGNQFDNSAPLAGAAYVFQLSSQPPPTLLYLSSTTAGSVTNTNSLVNFADEDILAFNQTSRSWSKYFDGSDVGLSATDIDAFTLQGNNILISLELSATLLLIGGTVGLVEPNDIVRFVPTSLGETTRGTFEWFLDGSDVGLGAASEDIDGIGFTPDGRLLVSTGGSYNVSTGTLTGQDEDILVLNNATFGSTTSGTWQLYFDGSDVNLLDSGEDVRGISYSQGSNDLYLATRGLFNVTGLSGDSSDVLICRPGTLGTTTACTFSLFFDGSANGFGSESIDGLQVNNVAQTVTVTTADADDTSVDDLNADDQAEEVEESNEEETINSQLFLPWSAR